MGREDAIARATDHYDTGDFFAVLRRRVRFRTVSQGGKPSELLAYLTDEIVPSVEALGFRNKIVPNMHPEFGPFLIAERYERDGIPTVLIYGHGDTVRAEGSDWRQGLTPWDVTIEGDRWYGRGTADNKGQHTVNISALEQVLRARDGKLGFNVKLLIEMGEETGSPGLKALCEAHREALAADLLIASDGPRLTADRPTIFLGSRGLCNFELELNLREGAHHSGNWGGLLRNPGAILANAIASLVDARGRILVERLRPPPIPPAVADALRDLKVGGGPNDPVIDEEWGEPGLSNEERVFAWNSLEVLAFKTGNPDAPQGAIPGRAKATLQLRFVVGTEWQSLVSIVREHLDQHSLSMVMVQPTRDEVLVATRLDPEDPWVGWAMRSIAQTTRKKPALLPNLGGSLPNDVFAEVLGMPTLWVPHSYPACSQHAPNEHLLGSVAREGLAMMAGLFWDLGEAGPSILAERAGTPQPRTIVPS